MKLMRMAVLLMVMLFFSSTAWSAGLTANDVQGFIATMQELKPYYDQYTEDVEDDGDATSTAQVVTDWASGLKERGEVEAILSRHGFDFESWATVAQQVTQAFMAVRLGKDGQDIMGQMQQSVAEIEGNKDIPAEYKSQMIAQMHTSMTEIEKALNAPPEDQEVVKPFASDLDVIFEMQE
jgi:hypothetical protein